MQKQVTHEHGYKGVLCREETKAALLNYRVGIGSKDVFQERRMVTSAIELLLAHPELHKEWHERVLGVIEREVFSRTSAAAAEPVAVGQ